MFAYDKTDLKLLTRLLIYLKPYKLRFVIILLSVLAGVGLNLLQPVLWARTLASLFGYRFDRVVMLIALSSIAFGAGLAINYLRSRMSAVLNQKLIFDLKKDLYKKILDLPVKAFDEIGVGEFISRLNGDAAALANFITNQLVNVLVDVVKILVIGASVFLISVPLSLVILLTFPLNLLIYRTCGRKIRKMAAELAKMNDRFYNLIQQSLLGIREIKNLGIKTESCETFVKNAINMNEKNVDISMKGAFANLLSQSAGFLQQTLILSIGGYLIFKKQLTVENFIVFSSYFSQFSASLLNISKLNAVIQQLLISLDRIFSMFDHLSYPKESFGTKQVGGIKGYIRFRNLHFGYDGSRQVLNGINLDIPPQKRIALVGPSGSGKSTLFNLLLRYYQPDEGSIHIDGIDLTDFDEVSLRSHIAIVRQEPFLFNMSIKENLLLANPAASDTDLLNACKSAYIHDFISDLRLGYDTMIGENGINLSGGQKQRLAIARALLKSSRIILFDEATSALDNESEQFIKKAIDSICHTHTVIVIAHRLSTIMDSDMIYVLNQGKIVSQGNHNELVKNCPVYSQLYNGE